MSPHRRYRPPRSMALIILLSGIAGTVAVIAVVMAVLLYGKLGRQADRVTAVVAQIQNERQRNIRMNCEETNRRHDRTVAQLEQLADGAPKARLEATIKLIDALAPPKNCKRLVTSQVKGTKP